LAKIGETVGREGGGSVGGRGVWRQKDDVRGKGTTEGIGDVPLLNLGERKGMVPPGKEREGTTPSGTRTPRS